MESNLIKRPARQSLPEETIAQIRSHPEADAEASSAALFASSATLPHRSHNSQERTYRARYRFCKRGCDLFGAGFLLCLLALPMLLIAFAVFADDGAPVLFRQRRQGRGGRSFVCLKFRTMHTDAPPACKTGELQDPRRYITRVGAFLRKTSLDELPQLWNVLCGSMSLVGPRPVVPTETKLLALRHAEGADAIQPGLTGLSQISGRDLLSDERKAALDGLYARHLCFRLDLAICFRTVGCVLSHRGIREGQLPSEEEVASGAKGKIETQDRK